MTAANPNPPQALQDEILADARAQAQRVGDHARQEAEALLAKAKADAQKEREERLAAARAEAKRRADLVLATVAVDVGRKRARCTEDLLDRLHRDARERVERREGFDYRAAVVRLAAEAVRGMEGDRFILQLAPADLASAGGLADEVRCAVGREGILVEIDPKPARIGAGVVVRDPDGRQEWDNSLQGRLERFWPRLRIRLGTEVLAAPRPSERKES